MKRNVLLALNKEMHTKVFCENDLARIHDLCHVLPNGLPVTADKNYILEHIDKADIVITSWGTAALDEEIISNADKLEFVAHAGGTVRPIVSDALWEKGIVVSSAAAAIAFGVSEFCLGLMLTMSKRVFWGALGTRAGKWREGLEVFGGPFEVYGQKVGILGAGHVGRQLIRLLKNFECDILLYDPYCSPEDVWEMGVTKVEELDDIFEQCKIVSINLPVTEETKNMIRSRHFESLPDGALLINTARSAVVNTTELVAELKKERFIACLDVTDTEPPALDDPLRSLPNVILTPHEAGAIAQNAKRIGNLVTNQIEAFISGKKPKFEITKSDLCTIA